MSVYVKGATQLEVCSFAEANRALIYGQRNRKVGGDLDISISFTITSHHVTSAWTYKFSIL